MEPQDNIKVFIHPEDSNCLLYKNTSHELPFFLPYESFEIIRDINDITKGTVVPVMVAQEIIPCVLEVLGEKINDVIILVMIHTHDIEYWKIDEHIQNVVDLWKPHTNNVLVCMTVSRKSNHPNNIWYDFLWNRAKLYYTNYDDSLVGPSTNRLWTHHATQKMFVLSEIKKHSWPPVAPFKPILAPVKSNAPKNYGDSGYNYRILCRKKLLQHLDDTFAYYSNWESKPRKLLQSQEPILINNGVDFHGWMPIANDYYNVTFVSAYVETLAATSDATGITEKTFDPLIKGHFILPFGYAGIIKDITEIYGFKLPEWIDYSYDNEQSDDLRFNLFIKELHRLSKISIYQYLSMFDEDKVILEYNRNVFNYRVYDSLSNKIKQSNVWKSLL